MSSIRQLTISSPKVLEISNSEINVILVSNFNFVGEHSEELTVRKGDLLKFISKRDNGWILVKFLDKLHHTGLIPASYVDIVINDIKTPINLNWLNDDTQTITQGDVNKDIRGMSDPVPIRSSQRTSQTRTTSGSSSSNRSNSESGSSNSSSRSSSQRVALSEVSQRSNSSPSIFKGFTTSNYKRSNSDLPPSGYKSKLHFDSFSAPTTPINITFNQLPSPVSPVFKKNYQPTNSISESTKSLPESKSAHISRTILSQISSISITNCLVNDSRYWYRIDIKTPQLKLSLGKFYQDFYNLHLDLLKYKDQIPRLPDPISMREIQQDEANGRNEELIRTLLKRCNELNYYVNKLNKLKFPEFLNWLELNNNELYAITNGETNDQINDMVLPNSINLFQV